MNTGHGYELFPGKPFCVGKSSLASGADFTKSVFGLRHYYFVIDGLVKFVSEISPKHYFSCYEDKVSVEIIYISVYIL